uniref:FadR/GntR family transcriptional regulator n=1 Tax=Marinobacterium profundum TaxID=1714300 RepID=UPI00082BC1E7|nr:FCD domain-containing protein [Marinobacterium profundum]
MNNDSAVFTPNRRIKRADQIVDSIKRWVVVNGKQPGERLPNERELMAQFDCAKGTVREALKSLEVQGLISIRTGPNGGAVLVSVPYDLASQLLRNFLHFEQPSGPDIYALRTLVEPEIAAQVTPLLSDDDLDRLDLLVKRCAQPAADFDERIEQRIAELEFHVVLAERCTNPLLAFIGRFLNDLIRDLVIFKKARLPEQREFSCANLDYHRQLMGAFRARDAEKARALMLEHMHSAEHFNLELQGQLEQRMLMLE